MKTSKKIALIANKGGVGKTTIALLLFEAFRKANKKVAFRDYDIQGSASKALEYQGSQDHAEKDGENYDVVIIDTPPSLLAPATIAAIHQANLILIPTSPSPLDFWEAEEAARFVGKHNPASVVRVVINKTQKGTSLTQNLKQILKDFPVKTLSKTLALRQSYAHAAILGWKALDRNCQQEFLEMAFEAATAL